MIGLTNIKTFQDVKEVQKLGFKAYGYCKRIAGIPTPMIVFQRL